MKNTNSETSVIDIIVREHSPGVWAWKRGGKRKYKREASRRKILSDDLDAARDCIMRSCQSKWWDWVGGSRPFFLR